MSCKVLLILHQGESIARTKIWRFQPALVDQYSISKVTEEFLEIYPDVKAKGLDFRMHYIDSFGGEINIESDADLKSALLSFLEEDSSEKEYLTIHLEEKMKRSVDSHADSSQTKGKRKKTTPGDLGDQSSVTACTKSTKVPKKLKTGINLDNILQKSKKEDDIDDQPLYVDEPDECIKCHWCPLWKGSLEVKVINQHVKTAKSHIQKRAIALGTDPTDKESPEHAVQEESPDKEVKCQGLYYRKYAELHLDRNAGGTTALKLWTEGRQSDGSDTSHPTLNTQCTCCTTYKGWKEKHSELYRQLQTMADNTHQCELLPDELVKVVIGGQASTYKGTIRANKHSTKGPCLGVAMSGGLHPYVCMACEALVHGKTSILNRKLNRASNLRNPRSDIQRATRHGVNHKYCSSESLQVAIQMRRSEGKADFIKIKALQNAQTRHLFDMWHRYPSFKPFIQALLHLLEEGKLSDFDVSFLKNWMGKKLKGKYHHADEQARQLSILYSNKLGKRMYTSTAPMLGLPGARQARRLCASASKDQIYLPGINEWALDVAAKRGKRPLQNGMDGTRVVRVIELYQDTYLVGKEFPHDVRQWPSEENLVRAVSWKQVSDYIMDVRRGQAYASEAYSFNLSDTLGKLPDIMTGSFPQPKKGFTAKHIFAIILHCDELAGNSNLPLIGHCTDSAANALNALVMMASPSTYLSIPDVTFLGLPRHDFVYFAPFLQSSYPSIVYPCWDHSSPTSLRNLMNEKVSIVAGMINYKTCTLQRYAVATIHDLRRLKCAKPDCKIRHADITPHVRQNCDATARVLRTTVAMDLEAHVPDSGATQLYIIASTSVHEPFRNNHFGSPPDVVKSLWMGLMIWRRWRRYIQLTSELTLQDNFISRAHYITLELLVHAGINHQLTLYHAFPQLPPSEYTMRNTGNRGIEAIHGVFRGGTTSLPITSANLSFCEFLQRMNKTMQIHNAEQHLGQVPGNPIVASKKKRITSHTHSSLDTHSECDTIPYTKPGGYLEFVTELNKACDEGDELSKQVITRLAPTIKEVLEKAKEWERPSISLHVPMNVKLTDGQPINSQPGIQRLLINSVLGEPAFPEPCTVLPHTSDSQNNDANECLEAIAQILTDRNIDSDTDSELTASVNEAFLELEGQKVSVKTILEDLQPFRELPSKDRGRRFAAGPQTFDQSIPPEHDIIEHEHWLVHPEGPHLRQAKLYLLGSISFISQEGKIMISASSKNPETKVMLNMYEYNSNDQTYAPLGRSGILKANKALISNVSTCVKPTQDGMVQLDIPKTADNFLSGFEPYHDNIDVIGRIPADQVTTSMVISEEEDMYLAEKIVRKRYNAQKQQYEYLIKWQGYAETENSWELVDNIPDDMLTAFEESLLQTLSGVSHLTTRKEGLRQTRTVTQKKDYILNL